MNVWMTKPELDFGELDMRLAPRVYLMYLLVQSSDIILCNLKNVMAYYGEKFTPAKEACFKEFYMHVRAADVAFDKFVPKDVEAAIEGEWRKLDGNREDANEVVRLLMYWLDRTERDRGLAERVMRMLKDAPEGGRYPENVISMFNMRRAK